MTSNDAWLIAGLGNPGPWFTGTRHNAGFSLVEHLATRAETRFRATGTRHRTAEIDLTGSRALLVKPLWTINQSGPPIARLLQAQGIPTTRLVVVQDDLDFPFGTLRLKRGGGPGGHNGIRSVTEAVGNRDYVRLRFGVGRPTNSQKVSRFVLSKFAEAEREQMPELLDRCVAALEVLVAGGLDRAQMVLHAAAEVAAGTGAEASNGA